MFKRLIASIVCLCFISSTVHVSYAQTGFKPVSTLNLPEPGTMVGPSVPFTPLSLKGLVINPKKPLEFQFIVDTGTNHTPPDIQSESTKLIKYFLAGLTIPEGDLWVNLSPYEKERITPQALGQTELGRDLLAQDYILKQLTASLIYPERDLGKEFWSRVYQQAKERFGTANVPVNTFNKVWILPDEAQVFENKGAVYVTKSTLKVMLDEDYLAMNKHNVGVGSKPTHMRAGLPAGQAGLEPAPTDSNYIGSKIIRDIVIPEITKEINTGKNFAPLRQIYSSLILAKWFKETIQNGLLDSLYTNKSKTSGINLLDPSIKQKIYERYLQAYKKGVFNYIKEDKAPTGQTTPRKYFSGGLQVMPHQLDTKGNAAMISTTGTFSVKVSLDVPVDNSMLGPQAFDEKTAIDLTQYISYRQIFQAEGGEGDDVIGYLDEEGGNKEIRAIIDDSAKNLTPAKIDFLITRQAAIEQSILELISNASDATTGRASPIGRFGMGAFQMLAFVLDKSNPPLDQGAYIAVDTATQANKGRRIIFFKGRDGKIKFNIQNIQKETRGTQVSIHFPKKLDKDFRTNLEKFLKEKLNLSTKMKINVNGTLINSLDNHIYLNGDQVQYELPDQQIDVTIKSGVITVEDQGSGMSDEVIFDKYLIPRLGENQAKPKPLSVQDIEKQVHIFYKGPQKTVKVAKSRIVFQVSGVNIQSQTIEGFSLPSEIIIQLPSSTLLTVTRDEIQIDEMTHEAIKILAQKIIDRKPIHQIALLNGFMQALRFLDEKNKRTNALQPLVQSAREIVMPFVRKQTGLVLPNDVVFRDITTPQDTLFLDEDLIYELSPEQIPGAVDIQEAFRPGTLKKAFAVPFKKDSPLTYLEFRGFLLLNQSLYEAYRQYPMFLNLRLNFSVGYGKEVPAKGWILTPQEVLERQKTTEKQPLVMEQLLANYPALQKIMTENLGNSFKEIIKPQDENQTPPSESQIRRLLATLEKFIREIPPNLYPNWEDVLDFNALIDATHAIMLPSKDFLNTESKYFSNVQHPERMERYIKNLLMASSLSHLSDQRTVHHIISQSDPNAFDVMDDHLVEDIQKVFKVRDLENFEEAFKALNQGLPHTKGEGTQRFILRWLRIYKDNPKAADSFAEVLAQEYPRDEESSTFIPSTTKQFGSIGLPDKPLGQMKEDKEYQHSSVFKTPEGRSIFYVSGYRGVKFLEVEAKSGQMRQLAEIPEKFYKFSFTGAIHDGKAFFVANTAHHVQVFTLNLDSFEYGEVFSISEDKFYQQMTGENIHFKDASFRVDCLNISSKDDPVILFRPYSRMSEYIHYQSFLARFNISKNTFEVLNGYFDREEEGSSNIRLLLETKEQLIININDGDQVIMIDKATHQIKETEIQIEPGHSLDYKSKLLYESPKKEIFVLGVNDGFKVYKLDLNNHKSFELIMDLSDQYSVSGIGQAIEVIETGKNPLVIIRDVDRNLKLLRLDLEKRSHEVQILPISMDQNLGQNDLVSSLSFDPSSKMLLDVLAERKHDLTHFLAWDLNPPKGQKPPQVQSQASSKPFGSIGVPNKPFASAQKKIKGLPENIKSLRLKTPQGESIFYASGEEGVRFLAVDPQSQEVRELEGWSKDSFTGFKYTGAIRDYKAIFVGRNRGHIIKFFSWDLKSYKLEEISSISSYDLYENLSGGEHSQGADWQINPIQINEQDDPIVLLEDIEGQYSSLMVRFNLSTTKFDVLGKFPDIRYRDISTAIVETSKEVIYQQTDKRFYIYDKMTHKISLKDIEVPEEFELSQTTTLLYETKEELFIMEIGINTRVYKMNLITNTASLVMDLSEEINAGISGTLEVVELGAQPIVIIQDDENELTILRLDLNQGSHEIQSLPIPIDLQSTAAKFLSFDPTSKILSGSFKDSENQRHLLFWDLNPPKTQKSINPQPISSKPFGSIGVPSKPLGHVEHQKSFIRSSSFRTPQGRSIFYLSGRSGATFLEVDPKSNQIMKELAEIPGTFEQFYFTGAIYDHKAIFISDDGKKIKFFSLDLDSFKYQEIFSMPAQDLYRTLSGNQVNSRDFAFEINCLRNSSQNNPTILLRSKNAGGYKSFLTRFHVSENTFEVLSQYSEDNDPEIRLLLETKDKWIISIKRRSDQFLVIDKMTNEMQKMIIEREEAHSLNYLSKVLYESPQKEVFVIGTNGSIKLYKLDLNKSKHFQIVMDLSNENDLFVEDYAEPPQVIENGQHPMVIVRRNLKEFKLIRFDLEQQTYEIQSLSIPLTLKEIGHESLSFDPSSRILLGSFIDTDDQTYIISWDLNPPKNIKSPSKPKGLKDQFILDVAKHPDKPMVVFSDMHSEVLFTGQFDQDNRPIFVHVNEQGEIIFETVDSSGQRKELTRKAMDEKDPPYHINATGLHDKQGLPIFNVTNRGGEPRHKIRHSNYLVSLNPLDKTIHLVSMESVFDEMGMADLQFTGEYDAQGRSICVTGARLGKYFAVLAIDPVTGQREVLSKQELGKGGDALLIWLPKDILHTMAAMQYSYNQSVIEIVRYDAKAKKFDVVSIDTGKEIGDGNVITFNNQPAFLLSKNGKDYILPLDKQTLQMRGQSIEVDHKFSDYIIQTDFYTPEGDRIYAGEIRGQDEISYFTLNSSGKVTVLRNTNFFQSFKREVSSIISPHIKFDPESRFVFFSSELGSEGINANQHLFSFWDLSNSVTFGPGTGFTTQRVFLSENVRQPLKPVVKNGLSASLVPRRHNIFTGQLDHNRNPIFIDWDNDKRRIVFSVLNLQTGNIEELSSKKIPKFSDANFYPTRLKNKDGHLVVIGTFHPMSIRGDQGINLRIFSINPVTLEVRVVENSNSYPEGYGIYSTGSYDDKGRPIFFYNTLFDQQLVSIDLDTAKIDGLKEPIKVHPDTPVIRSGPMEGKGIFKFPITFENLNNGQSYSVELNFPDDQARQLKQKIIHLPSQMEVKDVVSGHTGEAILVCEKDKKIFLWNFDQKTLELKGQPVEFNRFQWDEVKSLDSFDHEGNPYFMAPEGNKLIVFSLGRQLNIKIKKELTFQIPEELPEYAEIKKSEYEYLGDLKLLRVGWQTSLSSQFELFFDMTSFIEDKLIDLPDIHEESDSGVDFIRTGFAALDSRDDLSGLPSKVRAIVRFLKDEKIALVEEKAIEPAPSAWEDVDEISDEKIPLATLNYLYAVFAKEMEKLQVNPQKLSFGHFYDWLSDVKDADISHYTKMIQSAIQGQDKTQYAWIRELIQNARDSIRRARESSLLKPHEGDIDIRNFIDGDNWVISLKDTGTGMNLWHLLRYYFPLDQSSKDYRHDTGNLGQGNYTLFSDFDEVFIRTSDGQGIIHEMTIQRDEQSGPVITNWKVLKGDYRGTEIRRVKKLTNSDPQMESLFFEEALERFAGAMESPDNKQAKGQTADVRDVKITYNGKEFSHEIEKTSSSSMGEWGELSLGRTKEKHKRAVIQDGLFIKEPDGKELKFVPEWIRLAYERFGGISIAIPRQIQLNIPRTGYSQEHLFLPTLQAAVLHNMIQAILKDYMVKKNKVRIPGMPPDYFYNLETRDDPQAKRIAEWMNQGEYASITEEMLKPYLGDVVKFFELMSHVKFESKEHYGEINLFLIRELLMKDTAAREARTPGSMTRSVGSIFGDRRPSGEFADDFKEAAGEEALKGGRVSGQLALNLAGKRQRDIDPEKITKELPEEGLLLFNYLVRRILVPITGGRVPRVDFYAKHEFVVAHAIPRYDLMQYNLSLNKQWIVRLKEIYDDPTLLKQELELGRESFIWKIIETTVHERNHLVDREEPGDHTHHSHESIEGVDSIKDDRFAPRMGRDLDVILKTWAQEGIDRIFHQAIGHMKEYIAAHTKDLAMQSRETTQKVENPGGIDLNQIHVDRKGQSINIQFDPAQFRQLLKDNFEGFTPTILEITPLQSPLPLLGVG